MGCEVGGRFEREDICIPMADSHSHTAETTQYYKAVSLQFKIKQKKKKKTKPPQVTLTARKLLKYIQGTRKGEEKN